MSITRTPSIDVDQDFQVDVPVTKSWVDRKTGLRHIVGVATGVAEDRDGERVSKNCITGMGRKIETGGVKVTSSHQQDWMTEIGDVCKYKYDAQTDEMIVDGTLPPEGVDPIADKAWRTAQTQKVGWSIGGKLLKAFYEKNEVGKKRKVLDAIDLRHLCLTKNPSYPHSFAEAVAKTHDDEPPADDQFTLDADVEKDMSTGSWVSGDSDGGGGRDSVGSGPRNAGSKDPKSKGMNTEDDGSNDDDDQDLPKAKNERHLACPNCGHEFAADLPVDPNERQVDDLNDNQDQDRSSDTGKSTTEKDELMNTLSETLDSLKRLAAEDDVTKTTTPEPSEPKAEPAAAAAADEDGPTDVEKMVAASHLATEKRFEQLEDRLGSAFELVAKSHQQIAERLDSLPQGRKSTAIREHPRLKGENVEKTAEQRIAETDDPIEALKIANEELYGVPANAYPPSPGRLARPDHFRSRREGADQKPASPWRTDQPTTRPPTQGEE